MSSYIHFVHTAVLLADCCYFCIFSSSNKCSMKLFRVKSLKQTIYHNYSPEMFKEEKPVFTEKTLYDKK